MEIMAAPSRMQPFPVEAVAFEEDTYLVLSAEKKIRDPQKPFMHILTELIEIQPETPGNVLVKGRKPCHLLAVVHDLDQEPSWKEEWIEIALTHIFQEAEKRHWRSIAVPFLGTLYGKLEKHRFIELLHAVLNRLTPQSPSRLWLVVPRGTPKEVFEVFRDNEN
jgi:hypothetical protein